MTPDEEREHYSAMSTKMLDNVHLGLMLAISDRENRGLACARLKARLDLVKAELRRRGQPR